MDGWSGPNACGNGDCVDKVNGYTCDCGEGYELMLQGNDSVCVAKECGTSSRAWFSGADEDSVSGDVKCGADADFVPVGSLPMGSPRSSGVPVCTSAPWSFNTSHSSLWTSPRRISSTRPNEVSEKSAALSQVRADLDGAMRESSLTNEYFAESNQIA